MARTGRTFPFRLNDRRATRIASVFAQAGNAAGTGTANDASAQVKPNAGNAAGAGTASNASVSLAPNAGNAAGTGTGSAGITALSLAANAGNASGTGTAYNASTRQTAHAIADVATGSWTVAPLWSKVDEMVADDSDFITSETLVAPGNTSNADFQLTDPFGDPLSSTNHTIRVRAKVTFTLGLNGGLRAELREGTTLIATLTTDTLTTSYATYTYTLSAAEADSITDYADLTLRLYGNFPVGSLGGVQVSWFEFEIPGASVNETAGLAGLASGTGTANNASASLALNAGVGTGTGTAGTANASISSSAGAATGIGSAGAAAGSVSGTAGAATGTGAAGAPAGADAANAGNAAGTGNASTPAANLSINVGNASGTGTAYDATALAVTMPTGGHGRRGPFTSPPSSVNDDDEILILI